MDMERLLKVCVLIACFTFVRLRLVFVLGVCVWRLCLVFVFRFVISLLVWKDWSQQCKSLLVFV